MVWIRIREWEEGKRREKYKGQRDKGRGWKGERESEDNSWNFEKELLRYFCQTINTWDVTRKNLKKKGSQNAAMQHVGNILWRCFRGLRLELKVYVLEVEKVHSKFAYLFTFQEIIAPNRHNNNFKWF